MNIGEFFFGSAPEMQTSQLPRWSPGQEELMRKMTSWLGQGVGQPGEAYPGQSPYSSQLSQLSLSGLESMFGPEGLMNRTSEQLGRTIEGGPQDFEDYYQKSVYEPMMRQYKEDIMPGVGRSVGSAYWGSERLGQEEKATEDLIQSLTSRRAEMAYGARESALNRSLQAMGLAQGMPGMYGQGMEMGAQPGQWEYGEWQRQQNDMMQRMQLIMQALGLSPSETMAVGLPGQAGLLQGMAGGVGQGIGAGLGYTIAMSDRRLKKDIVYLKPIGRIRPALFRYIWEDDSHIHLGVIAQDLLKVYPQLVCRIGDFLGVNYLGLRSILWRQ